MQDPGSYSETDGYIQGLPILKCLRPKFISRLTIHREHCRSANTTQERNWTHIFYTGCPTLYRTRHFFNNSNTNKDIAKKQTHTTDTFLLISHTTNVLLFKFRCNIFIGVRIIKEMPGSVASGTSCSFNTGIRNCFCRQ
jgi:hypothetical protein